MTSSYVLTRARVPHLRCGICDQPLGDEPRVTVDDERCHADCARGEIREPVEDIGFGLGYYVELLR